MAMPSKVKTWSIDPCNRETAASVPEAVGDCMLGIKNALKLMSGVTVKGSSNGTTAAMDGVDRWSVTGDVQTRGGTTTTAQSWIVLDLANMGGVELLLCYTASTQNGFSFYFSPGGNYAVAATATHKPTATDEVTINAGNNVVTSTAASDRLWSTWVSSDGAALAFAIAEAGAWQSAVVLQQPTNRITSGTLQGGAVGYFFGNQLSHAFGSWGTARAACRVNTTNLALKTGTEGYGTGIAPSQLTSIAELQGSGHNVYPVSMWSDTSPLRGAVCTLIDVWCGNSAAADGDTYPNDTSRTYVQVSDFVFPWDGSVVAMT